MLRKLKQKKKKKYLRNNKTKKQKKNHYIIYNTGHSLAVTKGRGRGFPPATMSIILGYFHREQKENETRGTSWLFNSPPTNWIYPAM